MDAEFSDVVDRAFNALLEDAERLGPLSREHVVEVASRRGFNADQTASLLRMVTDSELLASAAATTTTAAAPGRGGTGRRAQAADLLRTREAMPCRLLDHPVLLAEQEVALGRRIQLGRKAREELRRGVDSSELAELAADGDAARQVLIRHNMRLVREIARGSLHAAGDLEFDDLVQEGSFGLNRAAEKFDPERGYKFSTYATAWIRQFISRAIDDTGTTIRVPVHKREELRAIQRYQRAFEVRNNRLPTLEEIASGVAKDTATVQAIVDIAAPLVRLDAPLGEDEEGATLVSVLLPPGRPVEEEVIDRAVYRAIERRLEELGEQYDPRFLRIMEGRFGLHGHDEMTLEALGKEFGITRERVRQLEKKIQTIIQGDPVLQAFSPRYREVVNAAA